MGDAECHKRPHKGQLFDIVPKAMNAILPCMYSYVMNTALFNPFIINSKLNKDSRSKKFVN